MNYFVHRGELLSLTTPFHEPADDEQIEELKRWGIKSGRLQDLVCYYPRGFKKSYTPDYYREFAINPSDLDGNDWAALFGLDLVLDPMGQLIYALYEKVAIEGYKSRGLPVKANPDYDVDDLLSCLRRDKELQNYQSQTIRAVQRYLKAVKRLPVFHKTDG